MKISPPCAAILKFDRADARMLNLLYRRYVVSSPNPFFIDIAGPAPAMTREQFADYCNDDDAKLWLCSDARHFGFFLISDIQPELALANLDLWFCDTVCDIDAFSVAAGQALGKAMIALEITRLQTLVLKTNAAKLQVLEDMGFEHEGILSEHLFHAGRYHDLVALARMSDERHD